MKLYIYEHCPFSARVRYVAGMLKTPLETITIDYDDDQTTTEIIGTKQVPLLLKDNGDALAESLDIIQYLLHLAGCDETHQPSQAVLDWQRNAFLPLQKVGYPRWANMNLAEFRTRSAQTAWRAKKETETLNFDALLQDTPSIAEDAAALIQQAGETLRINAFQRISVVDEAIVFSILRGFFSAAEIEWDPIVQSWMETVSNQTRVPLLR